MVAGVCAGIARRWGLDLALVRVVTVVLTLFSGVGLAAYIAAWLLTPSTEGPAPLTADSRAARWVSRTGDRVARRWPMLLLLVLLVVLLSAAAHTFWVGLPVGLLALVLLIAVAVGTRPGRWLLAIVAALLAAFVATVGVFGAHLGTRTLHVASVSDLRDHYDYGAGKLNLDLSALTTVTGRHRTNVRLGRGDVTVVVPQGQPVIVHGQSGFGTVDIDGQAVHGVDAEQTQTLGAADLSTAEDRLFVDVVVGVGKVTIRTA
jgi:phage shock protein PspC (stress-responsive transcriptional regulator)